MAQKKKASKQSAPPSRAPKKAKSDGGFIKRLADTKPKPKAAKAPTAKTQGRNKAAETRPATASAKNVKGKMNGKPVIPEPPLKKKPPSITITRPEVTRPPVVIPPPRPLEAPIGAPSILLPKGGTQVGTLTPIMRWMYVGAATRYEVEWSADAHFARGRSITLVSAQTAVTMEAANQLKPATNYFWRVRGGNDAGWGPWSPPETFRSPDK